MVHCCSISHSSIKHHDELKFLDFKIFFFFFFFSCVVTRERTGERVRRWREREGGNWLLQASREQDRWLDTGQSYTAKGCKRAMGKPCVCHEGTHTLSHTDPHICTPLQPLTQSCAHLPWVMRAKGSKQKEKQTSRKENRTTPDSSRTSVKRRLLRRTQPTILIKTHLRLPQIRNSTSTQLKSTAYYNLRFIFQSSDYSVVIKKKKIHSTT